MVYDIMINLIIKHLYIYSNCIYLYLKILNRSITLFKKFIFISVSAVILTFITILCKQFVPQAILILPFAVLWFITIFYSRNLRLSFVTCMISYALSYGVFILSSLIIITFCTILSTPFSLMPTRMNIIFSGIIQSVVTTSIFFTKRRKRGMPYLYNATFANIGVALGISLLLSIAFIQTHLEISLLDKSFAVIFIISSLFILLHWWQSQLTKAYRKRLAQLELESLRTELEQKTALLKKLETQNEEMGRLIHKDNKLIPAMEHAVSTYLASAFTDIALQQAQGEALLSDLKEFSEARRGILSTFAPVSAPKYNTGIPSLDAILVYMYQKAQVQGIRFYAAATPESIAALPPALTTEKLVHMLSDLLENAIIATKTSTEKQIQVQIYLANGLFTIEVADTGCSFEPATLISFGLEKASTHLTEGGSGIGLLDIWKIKEETKASIHIHEYEAGAPFSKKLFITFDKKNKYVIHTWRDKELSPLVNRGDIVILPQEQI